MWESILDGIKTNASTLALLIIVGYILWSAVGELRVNIAVLDVRTANNTKSLTDIKENTEDVVKSIGQLSERITKQELINEFQDKQMSEYKTEEDVFKLSPSREDLLLSIK